MNHQDDLASLFVEVGNDVLDQGPGEPLASPHGGGWRTPRGLQVVGEAFKCLDVD
jgi:hypothetical protein